MKRYFWSIIGSLVLVGMLAACKTAPASVAVNVQSQEKSREIEINGKNHSIRIAEVTTEENYTYITIESADGSPLVPEEITDEWLDAFPTAYLSGKEQSYDLLGTFFEDVKIIYIFDTDGNEPSTIYLYLPENEDNFTSYVIFDTQTKEPLDLFVTNGQGVDIRKLIADGTIGIEVVGTDSITYVDLKIWKYTKEDVAVKIGYGTYFEYKTGEPKGLSYRPGNGAFNYAYIDDYSTFNAVPVSTGSAQAQNMVTTKELELHLKDQHFRVGPPPERPYTAKIDSGRNQYIYPASLETSDSVNGSDAGIVVRIPVACMNYEKDQPDRSDHFVISHLADNDIQIKLLKALGQKPYEDLNQKRDVYQCAIWIASTHKISDVEAIIKHAKRWSELGKDDLEEYLQIKYIESIDPEFFEFYREFLSQPLYLMSPEEEKYFNDSINKLDEILSDEKTKRKILENIVDYLIQEPNR